MRISLRLGLSLFSIFGSFSAFADTNFGLNVGMGLPYLSQVGVNFVPSDMLSAELGYNVLDITANDVGVSLKKIELSVRWHPFSGSFYVGAGVGQQTLTAKAVETVVGETATAKVEVTSMTLTPQLGWMWSKSDGGLFFGMDIGLQQPSGAKATLTTSASAAAQATAEYQKMETDTVEQAEKFGETSFVALTLFRIGYLF